MDRIFEKFGKFYTFYVLEGFFIEENSVIPEGTKKCKKIKLHSGRTWDLLL